MKENMMNCFFKLDNDFETLSSRKGGEIARARLVEQLNSSSERITFDLSWKSLSPSFADECFGIIVKTIGITSFTKRVTFINVNDAAKSIIKHVVHKRASQFKAERESCAIA
jgi:hypothetical protein